MNSDYEPSVNVDVPTTETQGFTGRLELDIPSGLGALEALQEECNRLRDRIAELELELAVRTGD